MICSYQKQNFPILMEVFTCDTMVQLCIYVTGYLTILYQRIKWDLLIASIKTAYGIH